MIPMGTNPDDWVASIASYVRTSFGNSGSVVTAADVARVRTSVGTRKTQWTVAELTASLPTPLLADEGWKLSASHNTAAASNALTLTGWSSQAPQAAGMWFTIELPQPANVVEIQFDSPNAGGRGGGFGGGGRGGANAPQAAAAAGGGANVAAGPGRAGAAPGAPDAQAGGGGRGGFGGGGAAPAPNPGYPRGYKVESSINGTAWTLVAEGKGNGATTTIPLKASQARFLRITQTATTENAPPWSIQGIRLYAAKATAAK
jgi:hypothetical protein